jgi:hypothetical protein
VLAALVVLAACGGDDQTASTAPPPPPAQPEDFPSAKGKTLRALLEDVGGGGLVLAPSVSQLEPGDNRFGFGLFDPARAQIADAPVALYVARAGGGEAFGPFPARYETLAVKAQFQSRSVSTDPDAAKSVYVARLELPRQGSYEVLGIARLDGRLVAATSAGRPLQVRRDGAVPNVGDPAPRIHTETTADVAGDIAKIDTRSPPSSMHDVDFADVVGTKPVVLLFATSALCQSRVCGPVVDVTEQVKAQTGEDVAFVHQEIFRDNEIERGYRPQVTAWDLPTEPWVFTVGRDGRVAARIEGAFSAKELGRAIDAALAR